MIGNKAISGIFATNQAQVNMALGACPKAISIWTESTPSLALLAHWQVANIVETDIKLSAWLNSLLLDWWWGL
jgi:hypothetical protein